MSLLRFNNLKSLRNLSTTAVSNGEISPVLTNRNPRNLEKMRIGYKPDGYHVEKKTKRFWHRLEVNETGRHLTASVQHYLNGEVIRASTQEWAIKKQLFKTTDTSAYINIGRVLAQRCLECGIIEMECFIEPPKENGKLDLFLKALTEGGVVLKESSQYKKPQPWDQHRPEKPWEITD